MTDPTDIDPVAVARVARKLAVSDMTVYRLIEAGAIPAYRVGRNYRINACDLNAYLRSARTA